MTQPQEKWSPEIRFRIQTILSEAEHMREWGRNYNLTDEQIEGLIEPYNNILEELFQEDLRLAQLIDESDFVIGAEGDQVNLKGATIPMLTTLLEGTRKQYISLLRVESKEMAGKHLPKSLEPGVLGLATGSIFVGFRAPRATQTGLFGEEDPIYSAAEHALRTLGVASRMVAEKKNIDEISEVIDDPALRDAAIKAVQNLAPSGRNGIQKIVVAGALVEGENVTLSKVDRLQARELTGKVAKTSREAEFKGILREIDLDQHKFDLRRIDAREQDFSLRCVYEDGFNALAEKLLNKYIVVTGLCEYNKEGVPRLLHVKTIKQAKVSIQDDLMN